MSKRKRQRRKRLQARRLGTVKQRSPTPPPCSWAPLRPSKAQQNKTACRGKVLVDD